MAAFLTTLLSTTKTGVRPQQITFSAHRGTFEIWTSRCTRLDCPCTEITFALLELPEADRPLERPARIDIRVDIPTWQEVEAPLRSAQEAAVVAEFLRDYPPSERGELQRYLDEREMTNRRLVECRIAAARIVDRELVDFREVLQRTDDPNWDSRLGEYVVEHNHVDYLAIERYCPNPECPCREVVLSFMRCQTPADDGRPRRAEERFAAKLNLDGDVALQKVFIGPRSEAEAVLAAWAEEYGGDLEGLRWRYDKIKEIARRSWRPLPRWAEPDAPEAFEPRSSLGPVPRRAGRNDPCPCGSGKKFKKCCWRSENRELLSDDA